MSQFVYGTKVNVPEYMVKGGVIYRLITDQLGSVRLVVNASTGAVAQRIDYDEFGVVTNDTSAGFQPFGFAGGLYDPDTKLVRLGARDYDAETGRWVSKDPILFEGGDVNLYRYSLADSINNKDSWGMDIFLCSGPIKIDDFYDWVLSHFVDHYWIITDRHPEGIGAGPVAPNSPFFWRGENEREGTCTPIYNVDEDCVDYWTQGSIGEPGLFNNCYTASMGVLNKCHVSALYW